MRGQQDAGSCGSEGVGREEPGPGPRDNWMKLGKRCLEEEGSGTRRTVGGEA